MGNGEVFTHNHLAHYARDLRKLYSDTQPIRPTTMESANAPKSDSFIRSRLNRIKNLEGLTHANRYSVQNLAIHLGVSTRQLERFIQKRFGQSPHQWIHEVRMEKAASFLEEGMPLKELKELLGYKTAAHFSHDFKKHFGVAPSKWRSSGS